jgi:precorrin-6x reductase
MRASSTLATLGVPPPCRDANHERADHQQKLPHFNAVQLHRRIVRRQLPAATVGETTEGETVSDHRTDYVAKYIAKSTTPRESRPVPLLQVRVIGATGDAQAILAELVSRAKFICGSSYTYRTSTRPAGRAGHVRVYLTITRKEATIEQHGDG